MGPSRPSTAAGTKLATRIKSSSVLHVTRRSSSKLELADIDTEREAPSFGAGGTFQQLQEMVTHVLVSAGSQTCEEVGRNQFVLTCLEVISTLVQ